VLPPQREVIAKPDVGIPVRTPAPAIETRLPERDPVEPTPAPVMEVQTPVLRPRPDSVMTPTDPPPARDRPALAPEVRSRIVREAPATPDLPHEARPVRPVDRPDATRPDSPRTVAATPAQRDEPTDVVSVEVVREREEVVVDPRPTAVPPIRLEPPVVLPPPSPAAEPRAGGLKIGTLEVRVVTPAQSVPQPPPVPEAPRAPAAPPPAGPLSRGFRSFGLAQG
jgi:hypothetical protein